MYKSIELFAGAGGLALGLEQAGFEHIGLVEFDKNAAATLAQNRPNWKVMCEDVEEVAKRDLEKEFNIKKGELDLLSGGAPCQSFSYAGKRLGLEDVRGTMFYHYATFLHKLQPKMFLFENVRGLLTHDKGKTYKTILDIFEQEGYITYHEVLNAWDYGVAQKRERLITIGIRKDIAEKGDRPDYVFPKRHRYKPVLRDVLKNVPESECAKYSDYKRKIFELVPPGGYWRDIDEDIAKEYMKTCWYMGGGRTGILRRLSYDEPSLTVLTTPQMKQTDRCHPEEARPFSVRENARIQSFPDEWEFCGPIGAKYRQIGNAVPCNLAKEIGKSIISYLDGKENHAVKKEAREEIKQLVKGVIRRKINDYQAETEYKPFFEALFDKKDIQIGAIIQSLYTTFGMSVYEQISVILAKSAGYKAERQYTLKGKIDDETEKRIASYWTKLKTDLKSGGINGSDKSKEIDMIKESIKQGEEKIDGDSTVDVFIIDDKGDEYYIDITTVKNNLKGFEVLKLKMLRWIALRASIDKNVKVNSYIAIPYNPYYPEDYLESRWNSTILDRNKDILVQEDYWNFVGGDPNTYNELIEIFKEVGEEMKEEINRLFE